MALSQGIIWEVRVTGSDNNGGGFLLTGTGTDYSQQDAAQYTASDLTVDATTNTVVTSASHTFVAADVGNIMQITAGAGFTTAFYQIVSVAAGAATLDRSPAALSTSGGTYAVGGALGSPGMASKAKTANSPGTGSSCWIKAGTYVITSATANVSGGTVSDTVGGQTLTLVNRWEGYQTTRGDKGTRPVITPSPSLSMNSVNIFSMNGALAFSIIDNIEIDMGTNPSTSVVGFATGATYSHIIRCRAHGMATGFNLASGQFPFYLMECEAWSCTSNGFGTVSGVRDSYINCSSHDNGGSGFSTTQGTLINCISFSNDQYGFSAAAIGSNYLNCAAANNGYDGFSMGTAPSDCYVNCVAVGNAQWGFNSATYGGTARLIYQQGGGNGAGTSNFTVFSSSNGLVIHDTDLTADPYVSAGSGNFTLNRLTGGGATLRTAAYPILFPGDVFNSSTDLGPVQSQEDTASPYVLTSVAVLGTTTTVKVLGQSSPSSLTLTTVYTVPAATVAVISDILICNTNSSAITFRISAQTSGVSDCLKQYFFYDMSLGGKETYEAVLPITLGAGDTINVYASSANVAFSVFGCETV